MYAQADQQLVQRPVASDVELLTPEVPSPLVRRVLLFEFVALVEYWVAPLFLGLSNYAGIWSSIGYLLFGVLVATLLIGVLLPLRRHLASAFVKPYRKLAYHAIWTMSLLASLFATGTLQIGSTGPTALETATVYTPFGAWPGVGFTLPALHLSGAPNLEVVTMLSLLSILWAGAVVLRFGRPTPSCPVDTEPRPSWGVRVVTAVFWAPLGFMTSCAFCTPVYLAALAALAPGVALAAYNTIPLVPWIGLSGLLGLLSLFCTLHPLRIATARPPAESWVNEDARAIE